MPAYWTEDPSIGNALAGMADSFSGKNALTMGNMYEEMLKRRTERAALEQKLKEAKTEQDLREQATVAERNRLLNAPTPQTQWATGAGPIGAESVPTGGPAPLTALPLDMAKREQSFADQLAVQIPRSGLATQVTKDPGKDLPAQSAQSDLALTGVPQTRSGLVQMQTQLTGKLPMLAEGAQVHNYAVTDSQGNVVSRGSSKDGMTDLGTGRPIQAAPGQSIVKMGEAPFESGPYKDTGAQLQALENLTKIATQRTLTQDEQQRAQILLNQNFPMQQKAEKDNAGNIRIVTFREKLPSAYGPLMAQIEGGKPQGAVAAPGGAVPPASTPAPAPVGPAAAGPAPAVAPPAAGPAAGAPAPPIVPPGAVPGSGATASAPIVQGSGDEQLKEVLSQPTVKGAIEAGRAYNEMVAASKANTPEASLHMVYMLAKIYDPNSVVREGEVQTAKSTSPVADRIWGMYNQQLQSGQTLSPRAVQSFLEEGYKAANEHYATAKGLIDYAGERAKRLGLDPANVVPPLQQPQRSGAAPAATSSSSAPATKPTGGTSVMLDGKRYTKNPDGSYSGPY